LTPAERAAAPALYRTLGRVATRLAADPAGVAPAVAQGLQDLAEAGFTRIDYLEVCDAETLAPLRRLDRPGRALGAAWLGKTRLIDNIALTPPL
jgi:pantoate--beta-alanine ligase